MSRTKREKMSLWKKRKQLECGPETIRLLPGQDHNGEGIAHQPQQTNNVQHDPWSTESRNGSLRYSSRTPESNSLDKL